jgi:hypothetical protein
LSVSTVTVNLTEVRDDVATTGSDAQERVLGSWEVLVRNVRRTALLPFAIAVGGVLAGATPAFASVSASWAKPTDAATFTTTAPVDFVVNLTRSSSVLSGTDKTAVDLTLTVPSGTKYKVATSTTNELKFSLTPGCDNTNTPGPCPDGGTPAYNGRYTATLSGGATGSRTVTLNVPPAAPTGVTATATGQHRVKVAWAANREPDLTGYDVFTSAGQTVVANLPFTQGSYEFDLPDSGYGGDHSYVVRAHRLACANCDGSTDQLDSPMSAPATVTLTEPSTAPPAPRTDGGNGTTGNGNGSNGSGNGTGGTYDGSTAGNGSNTGSGTGTNTGTTNDGYNTGTGSGSFSSGAKADPATDAARRRAAFSVSFKSFAPKLGAPKLPPLPQFAPPSEAALPEGTYDPLLDYGQQTVAEKQHVAASGGVTSQLVDSVVNVFQGKRLFRSIAFALLLLLAAGHLRLWLRTTPPLA